MLEKPLFDPGFTPFVIPFYDNIEAINQVMTSIKNPKQRKFKYTILLPQINKLVENNISFYFGCLLWAKCLKDCFVNSEILNNSFLSIDLEKENISMTDITAEIDYLIEFFEKYQKNAKFYLSKELTLPQKWLNIAKIYREFVLINNSFINTKITNDIVLPNNINDIITNSSENNKILIEKALSQKNISILLKE